MRESLLRCIHRDRHGHICGKLFPHSQVVRATRGRFAGQLVHPSGHDRHGLEYAVWLASGESYLRDKQQRAA